jgi:hypothetical protein
MDIMNKNWDKPLTLGLCTSKLILIAPDGGDNLFGFRKMDKIENSTLKKSIVLVVQQHLGME